MLNFLIGKNVNLTHFLFVDDVLFLFFVHSERVHLLNKLWHCIVWLWVWKSIWKSLLFIFAELRRGFGRELQGYSNSLKRTSSQG